jgi:hypothetical protein
MKKHREADVAGKTPDEREERKLKRLKKAAKRVHDFLSTHEERKGAGGETVKSNITDHESGKIKGPVIQGYNGLAAADSKNQIIIAADANGSVAEGQFFALMLDKMAEKLRAVTGKEKPLEGTTVLADTGHFSEDNVQAEKLRKVRAVIPDQQYRNRDPDLETGERRSGEGKFDVRHFKHRKNGDYYVCLNGKKLEFRGEVKLNRNEGRRYESRSKDCARCLCKEQ